MMEAMRKSWTDERLGDFAAHTNRRFDAVEQGLNRVETGLRDLRAEVRAEMGGLRTEAKAEIGGLRREVKTEIGSLRADAKAEIGGLRREVKAEIGGLGLETKTEIADLRSELGALHRAILQLGGGMIATFAVGFAGLIATQL
jgi:F0F1-type ATP synthase membrane subunit b/b'